MYTYVLAKYLPCVASKHPSLLLQNMSLLGLDIAFIVFKNLLTSQEIFFIFNIADAYTNNNVKVINVVSYVKIFSLQASWGLFYVSNSLLHNS